MTAPVRMGNLGIQQGNAKPDLEYDLLSSDYFRSFVPEEPLR